MNSIKMKSGFLLLLILTAVIIAACGSISSDADDTDGDSASADGDGTAPADGDYNVPSNGLKISDIQNTASPKHPLQGRVALANILLTSDPFQVSSSGLMGIFVSDIGGGPYSGCMLTWKPTSASPDYGYDPPTMTKGMVVHIEGDYTEFCGIQEPYYEHCSTQIELTPFQSDNGKITATGQTSALPNPQVVLPANVKTGGRDADQWQHSLVQVNNAVVSNGDAGHGQFEIDGGLLIGDDIFEYTLPTTGQTFPSITGFLSTSYGDFKLLPRSAADLGQGTGTDGDQESVGGLKISDIQNPNSSNHPAINSVVTVEGIVVTSDPFEVSSSGLMGVFVSDIGGGSWSGCMLTWYPSSAEGKSNTYDPPAINKGDKIDVTGAYTEYCGYKDPLYTRCGTQIELSPKSGTAGSIGKIESGLAVPDAVEANPTDINNDGSKAEELQHSLVFVRNVEVTKEADDHDQFMVTGDLFVDDIMYDYTNPAKGTSYKALTGFLYTSYDEHKIVPRNADDMGNPPVIDGDTDTPPADGDTTVPDGDTSDPDGDDDTIVPDGDTDTTTPVTKVTINEVMPNDASDDDETIFVELHGPAGASLDGYKIESFHSSTGDKDKVVDLAGKKIPSDNFFVVCHTATTLNGCDMKTDQADMGNKNATIKLTKSSSEVDILEYRADVSGTNYATKPGQDESLARIPDGKDTDVSADDFIICDTPTPGTSNNPCGGIVVDGDDDTVTETEPELEPEPEIQELPIIINEVLPNDDDTDGEKIFIELYGEPGKSLNNFKIESYSTLGGTTLKLHKEISLTNKTMGNDGYFLICHPDTDYSTASCDMTTAEVDVSNNTAVIKLLESSTVVDEMGYFEETTTDYCDDPLPNQSVARIPNGVDTDDSRDDFMVCNSPTPGAANSCAK